jgi:hypothetical protein
LFQKPWVFFGLQSVREGHLLSLHNVHVLTYSPLQRLHCLTRNFSEQAILGFYACSYSSLEVLSIPEGQTPIWSRSPLCPPVSDAGSKQEGKNNDKKKTSPFLILV